MPRLCRTLIQPLIRALAAPLVESGDRDQGAPAYTPSLDFRDARNSQYIALLFEDF